jgi:hypothetical protein
MSGGALSYFVVVEWAPPLFFPLWPTIMLGPARRQDDKGSVKMLHGNDLASAVGRGAAVTYTDSLLRQISQFRQSARNGGRNCWDAAA